MSAAIAYTWHGGALHKARAAYPDSKGPWLDLSTGINPEPWPDADKIPVDWHRLPETYELAELEEAAAAHYGVPSDQICAVSGSEMAMRLCGLMLGDEGQCERQGYRTHRESFTRCELLDDLGKARLDLPLIVANPANPSGRILQRAELLPLLASRANSWTLIDEAYADAHPAISVADHIQQWPHLILFKSLGKFFGLAGLRLGFVIGPPEWIAAFRHRLGAWPVSAAAIAIGSAALKDHAWITATRSALSERAKRIDTLLQHAGIAAQGDCALFRLLSVPDAPALFHHLCRHAILTRPFEGRPHHIRIGIPARCDDFTRLEAALRCV